MRADGDARDVRDKQVERGEAAKMSLGKCDDGGQKTVRKFHREDSLEGQI